MNEQKTQFMNEQKTQFMNEQGFTVHRVMKKSFCDSFFLTFQMAAGQSMLFYVRMNRCGIIVIFSSGIL